MGVVHDMRSLLRSCMLVFSLVLRLTMVLSPSGCFGYLPFFAADPEALPGHDRLTPVVPAGPDAMAAVQIISDRSTRVPL